MICDFITTDFYQIKRVEIFAFVILQSEDPPEGYRFITGIAKIHCSAESLFDEAVNGFPGHKVVDLLYHVKNICDYLGIDYEAGYTAIFDMIDEIQTSDIAERNNQVG